MLVGVLSDTHGLIRPEALEALSAANLIIHAGDIGAPDVLRKLRTIAPVFAVKGNIDTHAWARRLPATQTVPVGQHKFHVLHDVLDLSIEPAAASIAAVIFGHSHQPSIEMRDSVLYLNPGSAGPRRFKLPVCIARVDVAGARLTPTLVELAVR